MAISKQKIEMMFDRLERDYTEMRSNIVHREIAMALYPGA